jgi:two-component system, OmpR family, phosphate regulon sensor histidine kinase PhoR
MSHKAMWFFHPIFVFVFSIAALSLSLVLYIYWYVEASAGLKALIRRYNLDPNQFLDAQTWVVILVVSILMAIILAGTIIIFIYGQKMVHLYSLQYDFINNFTHELKTPVTSLKLYLETFLKHDLPREEQRKYIRYMLQDADRLSDNISQILNLARIETKTYRGEFRPLQLVNTIEQFLARNVHLFENCDIHVHNPSGATFLYLIDPLLFDMLLMNLVVNGIRYNDSERPILDIRFMANKNRLRISFEDNGIGIHRSDRKKIFKKFYRVTQSDGKASKGSGLGLYLVQNIARIHKGKMTVAPRDDGKGSVFTLSLPLKAT